MSIEIRPLNSNEFEDSLELSQFAFQYEVAPDQIEVIKERQELEPAQRIGGFSDGKLAAQLTILELQTYIGGKAFAMGGIAGVATWPEYRRQGLVSQLLKHSLQQMREKGQTISYLHPFAVGFYRKFGWELFTDNKKYKINTALLPARSTYNGTIARQPIDDPLLAGLYDTYAKQYNGPLVRTEAWWKYRVKNPKKGHAAVYYGVDTAPQGYVFYEVKNRILHIHELIALTEEARQGLWSYLAQHDSMIDHAEITVAVDDQLAYLLPNPRIQIEIQPYFMARIVDAAAFLEQYTFLSGIEETILLDIKDEHAPWNNGLIELHLSSDGSASVTAVQEAEIVGSTSISITIGTLSAILLGYRRPAELSRYEKITGDSSAVARL